MNPKAIIDLLKGIEPETQSAYVQHAVGEWGEGVLDVLKVLIENLHQAGDPTLTEYKQIRRFIDLIVVHIPKDYSKKPPAYKDALLKCIEETFFLEDRVQRLIPVEKLMLFDAGNPRRACQLLCRGLDRGREITPAEYSTLLPGFESLVFADVDSVLTFLKTLEDSSRGSDDVIQFVQKLRADLRIVGLEGLSGASLRKLFARQLIGTHVIESKTSILIVGPSGSSKTFSAKKIAPNSEHRILKTVNCAGPKKDLAAALESAEITPTTILLDEVYAMPARFQNFCLAEFGRTGLNLRLISTSSKSILELEGILRPDFLNRIKGWTFELRPLSDSPTDVEEAIRSFVEGRHRMEIDEVVVSHLRDNHPWPGNFREVEQVTDAICLPCKANGIDRISVDVLIRVQAEISNEARNILRPLL